MTESADVKQIRLHHERECRRIAELVRAELPEDRAFILITASRGPGQSEDRFASVDYVATMRPDDAQRLLQEISGPLSERAQSFGEPTAELATLIREHVARLVDDEIAAGAKQPPDPSAVIALFQRARRGAASGTEPRTAFVSMAVVAFVELEWLRRREARERG